MSALEKAINYSKKIGVDECEIVLVKRRTATIRITDSEIFEVKENIDENYGIRIIHNKKTSSNQTNDGRKIQAAIDRSFESTSHLKPRKFWRGLPDKIESASNLEGVYDEKINQISGTSAADIAQEMINSASDSKIKTISGSLNIVSEKFKIANSNGLFGKDDATYIAGIINADSDVGESSVSGIGQNCCRTLKEFCPEQIGSDARTMCVESINPKKCETGEFAIIFEPYSVGEILAFVIAPNFNFKNHSEKKSCFSNHFNEKIAPEEFNITDNPHMPQGMGTKPFDEEGVKTRVTNLVEKGVFSNTYSNLFDSYKENMNSTGNAARPGSPMGRSAEPIPMSLPHNLQIKSGRNPQEEMVRDTKRGLIVGRLWYTYAVNPIKGDFSCTARSGIRLIEDGKIKHPCKPVRIIHNLRDLLQNVSAVGNNARNVLQWASLPSNTPSIKVEKIKVISI